VGKRDPLEVISTTPSEISNIMSRLGQDRLEKRPAAGKWSIREILCHLADTELVFGVRLRQAIAEDHHTIQPFDQEKWAAPYEALPAAQALEVYTSIRRWNLAFINTVSESDRQKQLTHPERGTMTFQVLVETMSGHDMNHLGQIEALGAVGMSRGY
jgi:uncharacterized damage-inducible protein DinB